IEHHFGAAQTTDCTRIVESMCTVATEEYRVAHTARFDRRGETFSHCGTDCLQVRRVPTGRHHQIDPVSAFKGLCKERNILQMAHGRLGAQPDQSRELLGSAPDHGYL